MLSYPHTQPCLYNESTFCLLLENFFFLVNFRIIFNSLFPTQLIWLFLVLHILPTSPTANYLCIFSREEGRKESAALCFTMSCPFLPQAKNRAPGHSPLPFWLIWLKKKKKNEADFYHFYSLASPCKASPNCLPHHLKVEGSNDCSPSSSRLL